MWYQIIGVFFDYLIRKSSNQKMNVSETTIKLTKNFPRKTINKHAFICYVLNNKCSK